MDGASLVHPDQKVVIPLAPEPILKGDGATKNDCERNASKRLLQDLRREHPHLKILIVEDALASNYPHLSLLDSLAMDYIVGIKPGDHRFLFDWINDLPGQQYTITDKNQGYHFEHNYGHGDENLCSVMSMLMMLAFLIDQGQQLCCKSYQKARNHVGTFAGLFEFVRVGRPCSVRKAIRFTVDWLLLSLAGLQTWHPTPLLYGLRRSVRWVGFVDLEVNPMKIPARHTQQCDRY